MKKIFLYIAIVLSVSSCKKYLSEDSRSNIATQDFYKTKADFTLAVNGIYLQLYQPYTFPTYASLPFSMIELATGQYTLSRTISGESTSFYNLQYPQGGIYVRIYWQSYYRGIEGANNVITKIAAIDDATINAADKSTIMGEASFLRAYFYYNLVNIFGAVPLKLTPTIDPNNALLPKTSVKDIYEKVIIPDLLIAEKANLPQSPAGNGRISIGAAKTLLAKAYLSMSGQPVNDVSKVVLARDKALEVINSKAFQLFQSDPGGVSWFEKLNNPAFNNLEEIIWDLNYTRQSQNSPLVAYFLPNSYFNPLITSSVVQLGTFSPSPALINSYATNDLRGKYQFGFFYNQLTLDGTMLTFDNWYSNKYFDKSVIKPGSGLISGLNTHLLRYSDLLLTYAEAQNEADGGPNSTSYDAVNSIRTRAGLAVINNLSKQDFKNEVWKERYWELNYEGQLWFDIVRTRKVFDGVGFQDIIGFKSPSGAVFTEKNLTFPIPLSEIQINPLLK